MMESQEEHDEYKRKQHFDYLTSDLLKEKKKHTLAKIHFRAWGDIIFYISAFVTLVQTVLATLAQSKAKKSQDIINITIAALASFSVFWQSLIKHWNYGGRSSMHESAAVALGKIYNIALLKARLEKLNLAEVSLKGTKTTIRDKKGGENVSGVSTNIVADGGEEEEKSAESLPLDHPDTPGEDSGSSNAIDGGSEDDKGGSTDTPTTLTYTSLTKMFEQAIDSCTSQVPAQIAAAFELLDNRVGACKRKVHNPRKSSENSDIIVEWEKIYPALYRQLTATIIAQPFWPYTYPDPEAVVNQTLEKYSKELKETALLDDLLKRNIEIDKQYEAFEKSDQIA